jgi:hypothetical protein
MPVATSHANVVRAADELALELVGMVRDVDPVEVWERMNHTNPTTLFAAVIALASMVDDERTPAELRAWMEGLRDVA